jgi:opacity protein-like surface antigen
MRYPVVFFLFFLLPVIAGEHPQEVYADIGLEIGWNSARLNFTRESEEWKPLNRFQVGAFINFPLSRRFELQPEIHYVGRGAAAEGVFLNQPLFYRVRLDYIEISSLVKYRFFKTKRLQPSLFVGGYVAFNTGARAVMEYSAESWPEDIADDIENTDFGFIFGAGIDFKLSQSKFLLDFRVNMGMKSINKIRAASYTIKNESLSVMLGYSF